MVDNTLIQRIMSGPVADFLTTYKVAIGIFIAFVYITIIIILAINIAKLADPSSHPLIRKKILDNIMISMICLALISAFSIFYVLIIKFGLGLV